jgi:hypothetical protein
MQQPHFTPELGQSLTPATASHMNYRLLATSDETTIYGKQISEQGDAIYIVCVGSKREIMCITSRLAVATFASTLTTRPRP